MAKFVPQFEIVYESIDIYNQNLPILIFNDRGKEYTFIYYRESFGNYNHVFKIVEYFRGPIVLDDSINLVMNFSQLIRYSFERINNVINVMKKYKEPTKSNIYNDMMTPEGFFKYHSIPNFSYNDTLYVNQISALKQFPYFKEFHKQILIPYYSSKLKHIKDDIKHNNEIKPTPKPKFEIPETLKPITQELKDIRKPPKPEPKQKEEKEKNETFQILQSLNKFPYRSNFKLSGLYNENPLKLLEALIKVEPLNQFSIKENKKKYHLKVCSKIKYSFIGDIFFQSNKFAYLLLINVNTRKAYYYPLGNNYKPLQEIVDVETGKVIKTFEQSTIPKKDVNTMIKAFDEIMKMTKINVLEFDGEKSISSSEFQNYLNQKNIKFKPLIPGSHTSTGLMDRLCKTIRDIAFNMGADTIDNELMNKIIKIYNSAPHKTLTKILFNSAPNLKNKFKYGISPNDVENNEALETLFVETCLKYNALIKSQDDYALAVGDKVRIYNKNLSDKLFEGTANKTNKRSVLSKDIYIVNGYYGNLIELQGPNNEKIYKPRRDLLKL